MTLVSSYDMEVKAQVVSRHKDAMPKGKHDKTAAAISDVESPASHPDQLARAAGPHNVSPHQSISTLSAKPAPSVQKLRRKITSDVNDPDNAAIDMINVQRRRPPLVRLANISIEWGHMARGPRAVGTSHQEGRFSRRLRKAYSGGLATSPYAGGCHDRPTPTIFAGSWSWDPCSSAKPAYDFERGAAVKDGRKSLTADLTQSVSSGSPSRSSSASSPSRFSPIERA